MRQFGQGAQDPGATGVLRSSPARRSERGRSWCARSQEADIDFEDLQRADFAFELLTRQSNTRYYAAYRTAE